MPLLRAVHRVREYGRHHVALSLTRGDGSLHQAEVEFDFALTPQQDEEVRWYYEDYLQYQRDPAPLIAARIERWMTDTGIFFFRTLFEQNTEGRTVWAALAPELGSTRVEIKPDPLDAGALPWELLREPHGGMPLALSVGAFVFNTGSVDTAGVTLKGLPGAEATLQSRALRILVVICRPEKGR